MTKMANNRQKSFEIENPLDVESDGEYLYHEKDLREMGLKSSTIITMVATIALLVLFGRTFYLQAMKGYHYKDIAENNRIREFVIRAPRGLIEDSQGTILAQNIPSFDAVFIPAHLPTNKVEYEQSVRILSSIIRGNIGELEGTIGQPDLDDRNTYLIKENITSDQALEIIERTSELPGIYVGNTARREYVDGETFSHIIGYDGIITKEELEKNPKYIMTDNIGKSGIEYSYEKFLHGKHGAERFEVDSNNNIKENLGVIKPIQGDALVLHLDAELQKYITKVLRDTLETNEDATSAVAVAIDPRNGGIKAMVSLPSYDNNLFSGGIENEQYQKLINDETRPLLNRAIGGEYPPGSTFKPFIAAVALQEGVITEHTTVNCSGGINVGAWSFPDWKAHGLTDVRKAIAESCDVFFYSLGGGWGDIHGLGIDRIKKYAPSFGLGELLGIDLPGETDGNIPDKDWKFKTLDEKWYIGDSYHAAIGQGFITVTPLQIVSAVSTIANGGNLYRPHVVEKIIPPEGEEMIVEPEIIDQQIVEKQNIQVVREGMRRTVAGPGGSGIRLNSLEVQSAGKTGTAQFGADDKTHSWYVSFAPYDNPEFAMVVLFEGGGEGHDWAVPATYEILKWYYDCERGNSCQEENSSEDNSFEL